MFTIKRSQWWKGKTGMKASWESADTTACPPTLTHLQLQHTITVMMQPEIVLNKLGGMLSIMRS